MVIFISEQGVKTMAVNADIVVTYVPEEAVCCGALQVPLDAFVLMQGAPLVGVVA